MSVSVNSFLKKPKWIQWRIFYAETENNLCARVLANKPWIVLSNLFDSKTSVIMWFRWLFFRKYYSICQFILVFYGFLQFPNYSNTRKRETAACSNHHNLKNRKKLDFFYLPQANDIHYPSYCFASVAVFN